MLKKFLILLGVVFFISCGGESSKEAKELLQKILTIIGIPPSVITNICQTSNQSDICEGMTLYSPKSSDDKSKMWAKIEETGEGQYLITTDTPCRPILLKLQDGDVVDDDGEFMLKFSGVEFGKNKKELSILEAMVDAMYLSSDSVTAIKSLENAEAQNSFYALLYQDLKTNINRLRTTGLTQTQAIRGTLKEMADELLSFGMRQTLPSTLNGCNGESLCIGQELEKLSAKLLVDGNESIEIYGNEKDNLASLQVREVSCEEPKVEEAVVPVNKLLKKETYYRADGTNSEDTYIYDENNRLKEIESRDSDDKDVSIWKYSYSKDKVKLFSTFDYNGLNYDYIFYEIVLENDIPKELISYTSKDDTLFEQEVSFSQKVLEYDSKNRPLKTEIRYKDPADGGVYPGIYRYNGEYLVYGDYIHEEDEEFYDYDYKYDRRYKCITGKDLIGGFGYLALDINEYTCLNWTSLISTNKRDNSTSISTQEIIYDKDGYPTQIDTYEKNNKNEEEHTYIIYEYE